MQGENFSNVKRYSYMVYILKGTKGPGTGVQVVTMQESGMRCSGEAKGTPGKAWESGLRCGKAIWRCAE
jgi:hypothetical protein